MGRMHITSLREIFRARGLAGKKGSGGGRLGKEEAQIQSYLASKKN